MSGYVGIDAGGTLIKIVYRSNGSEKELMKFTAEELDSAASWVRKNIPLDARIGFTGGRGNRLRDLLPEYASAVEIPEFEATAEGAVRIMQREAGGQKAATERWVLVNVGTGTSLHVIEGAERLRLGGIGLGGGTIVGLTGMLCGLRDYDEIVRLAPLGSREAVDLTVGQIYAPAPPPIAGDLTAANFARQTAPESSVLPQDYAAAVIGMVAELVVTVGVQAAKLEQTTKVVYVGSSYENNALLHELTFRFTKMLGGTAVIPSLGAYSGAIGALHKAAEHFKG